jgi:amidohydrolase
MSQPPASSLTRQDRQRLVALRRDLHRHPELAYGETRTAGIIADHLEGLGLAVTRNVAGTGVVAVIRGGAGPGLCLMLRADMDALPITEVADRPHRSQNEGVMHACGHDGHVATLLIAAELLVRESAGLKGSIKLVFQPAEEGRGGASRMIDEGVLTDPAVDAAFGLHYWALRSTGVIGITEGPSMGAVDGFSVVVQGRGGHAAIPHETRDALVAAAHVVTALQTVVSRRADPQQPVVVTVGELHAGTAFNVIPGEARLAGTVRCFDPAIWAELPGWIGSLVDHTCKAHGCEADLQYRRLSRPLVNDPAMSTLVREVAAGLVGEDSLVEEKTLGGEDMGEFLDRVPGCFAFVGAQNADRGIDAPHHHPAFDLDEDALSLGVELMLAVARRYLAG